jgi:hypothetical protein
MLKKTKGASTDTDNIGPRQMFPICTLLSALHRQGIIIVLHLVLILINITVLLFVQNDELLKVLWIFLWI